MHHILRKHVKFNCFKRTPTRYTNTKLSKYACLYTIAFIWFLFEFLYYLYYLIQYDLKALTAQFNGFKIQLFVTNNVLRCKAIYLTILLMNEILTVHSFVCSTKCFEESHLRVFIYMHILIVSILRLIMFIILLITIDTTKNYNYKTFLIISNSISLTLEFLLFFYFYYNRHMFTNPYARGTFSTKNDKFLNLCSIKHSNDFANMTITQLEMAIDFANKYSYSKADQIIMFKLGEVKVPEDKDFEYIRQTSLDTEGWTIGYEKNNVKVWSKPNELSSFNMIKIKADLSDISANTLYNTLHDSEYRATWDSSMLEAIDVCWITPNSNIGYYGIKSPKPFKNRDFVLQSCWIDFGEQKEKIMYNHSVNHAKHPTKKGFVRGISYLTSYCIIPTSQTTCTVYYVTQSDPGGSLPSWLVNRVTKVLAPKMMKKLQKAALKYDKWKSKQKNPNYKPWIHPDQIVVPRIDWNDIIQMDLNELKSTQIDETNINEKEAEGDDDQDKDD